MIVQCDKSLHSKTIHPLINIGCLSDISNTFIETGFYRIILKTDLPALTSEDCVAITKMQA